jgi:hypothetical protein
MPERYPGVRVINMRSSAGPRELAREWREKSDWSKDISECFLIIYPHKMEENLFNECVHP